MKKFTAFLFICLCLFTSCSDESSINEPIPEKKVVVNFNFALKQEISPFVRTKSIPSGIPGEPVANNQTDEGTVPPEKEETLPADKILFIELGVYENNTDQLIEHRQYNVTEQQKNLKVQYSFTAGIYKVRFIAHSTEGITFAEESNLMTFKEMKDTFWGSEEIEIDATQTTQSFTITLNRIVAGVEFVPTDIIPENIDFFSIETSGIYNKINLLDGSISKETMPFSINTEFKAEDKQPGKYIKHFFYTFVPEPETEATTAVINNMILTSQTSEGDIQRQRKINNAPLYKNRITRYTGTLYTPSIVDGNFELVINTDWGEYHDEKLD